MTALGRDFTKFAELDLYNCLAKFVTLYMNNLLEVILFQLFKRNLNL